MIPFSNRRPLTGYTFLPLVGAIFAIGLAGCGNTLNGAKQDTANDTQKAATAADQAAATTAAAAHQVGTAVAKVPQDAAAATVVTPEVKTAIVRDPVLNDPRNLINVASADNVTRLTGHVVNASMKQRATEDAQAVLSKRHSNYTVSNDLAVTAPGS